MTQAMRDVGAGRRGVSRKAINGSFLIYDHSRLGRLRAERSAVATRLLLSRSVPACMSSALPRVGLGVFQLIALCSAAVTIGTRAWIAVSIFACVSASTRCDSFASRS